MARSPWDNPLPDATPYVAGLDFGADPCWSPDRENVGRIVLAVASDLATRDLITVDVCAQCLSQVWDTGIHPLFPCAACLETTKDDRLAIQLADTGIPDSDQQALLALAELREEFSEADWLRSIQPDTDPDTKENIVVIKTTRKLGRLNVNNFIPGEVKGVRIVVQEPVRRKTTP